MKKWSGALGMGLGLLLMGCSEVAGPPEIQAALPGNAGAVLELRGDLNGRTVQGALGNLQVSANANTLPGRITVQSTPVMPTLPPVAVVNSSYIIGEVPGVQAVGSWRVQVSPVTFEASATLSVNRPAALMPQSLDDTVTEMFVKDNLSGEVSLVGTYRNDAPLIVGNFADRVNEELGQAADLTYFAYLASAEAYDATCLKQGGDVELNYCSFRNKVLPNRYRERGLSLQAVNFRALTYNVGNVAATCGSYRYKICYQVTERKVSDQILNQEYTFGKPGVVMLQEMWHGDCRGVVGDWFTALVNPQLCDGSTRNVPSAVRILGNRYSYACTVVQLIGGAPRNGYECTAVDPEQFVFSDYNVLGGPERYGFHPLCAATDKWIDTGFQVTRVYRFSTATRLTLVNSHLSGTVDNDCRAAQIQGLAQNLRLLGNPPNLIAGDMNTEPYNDALVGGQAFRREFLTPEQPWQAVNPVATLLDSGRQPSARYVWGTPALDHVLSNTLTGSCSVFGFYDGTDHALTNCLLN